MADVITRFKLETNQFDSALRDASNGLSNITKQLTLAGKDFEKFAAKHVETARSLGQVESGANNLKDKLRDLVSAYNNVAKAYNNLTKEQQKTDFGKAMAASLDQLQGRIKKTKNELYSMSDSAKKARGSLGSLNDIFGTSITKLAGWGAAIAAAKGALNVAKDAFFASEQNVDAWGSAVEESKAVYESFLTSINSGDISGFLSRIGEITNAAIEAYNALDQLSTQKTIQSPQVAVKQAEISRMRTMLQTGRYVAPADGRTTGGMKTGDILTKEQISNISKNLEQALNEVATITRSQVKTASTAIDKLYAEQAAVLGVSKQRFQQATSSWQNFQAAMDNANAYEKWRKENTTYTTQTTSTGGVIRTPNYDDSKNPYRDWAWVSRFKDDGERFQRLIQEIQNRESAKSTLYSQYGQAYRRINRAEGINPYGGNGGGGRTSTVKANTGEILFPTSTGLSITTQNGINAYINLLKSELSKADLGSSLFNGLSEQLADTTTLQNLVGEALRAGLGTAMFDVADEVGSDFWTRAMEGGVENIDWQNIVDKINEAREAAGLDKIKLDFDTGNVSTEKEKENKESSSESKDDETYAINGISKMSGGINSLVSSVEQLGIELPDGLKQVLGGIQAVTSILTSIMTIVEAIQMLSSATSFIPFFGKNGGLIPHAAGGAYIGGTHYSGDVTPVMANAGELILNKAAQGNIASMLQDGEQQGGGNRQPYVSGEQIYIGLNNYLLRSGKGELLTAR